MKYKRDILNVCTINGYCIHVSTRQIPQCHGIVVSVALKHVYLSDYLYVLWFCELLIENVCKTFLACHQTITPQAVFNGEQYGMGYNCPKNDSDLSSIVCWSQQKNVLKISLYLNKNRHVQALTIADWICAVRKYNWFRNSTVSMYVGDCVGSACESTILFF